jgi:hypothetical protein
LKVLLSLPDVLFVSSVFTKGDWMVYDFYDLAGFGALTSYLFEDYLLSTDLSAGI